MKNLFVISLAMISLWACAPSRGGDTKATPPVKLSSAKKVIPLRKVSPDQIATAELADQWILRAMMDVSAFLKSPLGGRILKFIPKDARYNAECLARFIGSVDHLAVYIDGKSNGLVLLKGRKLSLNTLKKCTAGTSLVVKQVEGHAELSLAGNLTLYGFNNSTLLLKSGTGHAKLTSAPGDLNTYAPVRPAKTLIAQMKGGPMSSYASLSLGDTMDLSLTTNHAPWIGVIKQMLEKAKEATKDTIHLASYLKGIRLSEQSGILSLGYHLPKEKIVDLVDTLDFMKIALCNDEEKKSQFTCSAITPGLLSDTMLKLRGTATARAALKERVETIHPFSSFLKKINYGTPGVLLWGDVRSIIGTPSMKVILRSLHDLGEESCLTNVAFKIDYLAGAGMRDKPNILLWARGEGLKQGVVQCANRKGGGITQRAGGGYVLTLAGTKMVLRVLDDRNIVLHSTSLKPALAQLSLVSSFQVKKERLRLKVQDRRLLEKNGSDVSFTGVKALDFMVTYGKDVHMIVRTDYVDRVNANNNFSGIVLYAAALSLESVRQRAQVERSVAFLDGATAYTSMPLNGGVIAMGRLAFEVLGKYVQIDLEKRRKERLVVSRLHEECKKKKARCDQIPLHYLNKKDDDSGAKGAALAEKYCKKGVSGACYTWGWLKLNGRYTKKDRPGGYRLIMQQCRKHKVNKGCRLLGYHFGTKGKTRADLLKAVAAYRIACGRKDANSCRWLGNIYRYHHKKMGFHARDAGRWFKKACDLKSTSGCFSYAYYLSYTSRKLKLKPNYKKAFALYKGLCHDKKHLTACNNAGDMYEKGYGVAKDLTKALTYYNMACEKNDAVACSGMGDVYGMLGEKQKQAAYNLKACKGGFARSCYQLGIQVQKGDGVNKDPLFATQLFKAACQKGHKKACAELDKE